MLVPDLLAPNLDIVFCGTALGRASFQQKAYYAHPGNRFWSALFEIGLTPHLFPPKDYQDALKHGIGLTDMCKTHYGNDDELPKDAFDACALENKILKYQPSILAFTSKNAARAFLNTKNIAFGLQKQAIGKTRLFILPSPSGQARRFFDTRFWQDVANLARALH